MSTRSLMLTGLLLLTACSTAGSSSDSSTKSSASPDPTADATEQATPTPSATSTPMPTAHEAGLAVDAFAEVVTTDLVVRSAPGTGRDSVIYGTVNELPVLVLDGPVQADGYEWWLVVPEEPYTLEPWPSGWVAAGGQGEVWLAPRQVSCEAAPASDDLWAMPTTEWIGCHRGAELSFRGYLSGCRDELYSPWDNACGLRNCSTTAACEAMVDDRGIGLHFDAMPARDEGQIRVTGHFDDALAQRCAAPGSADSALLAFRCRVGFVVTSYRFVPD